MIYRREDAFRYEFEEPLDANFKVVKIDSKSVDSSEGELLIIDVSPGGMKIAAELEFPDPKKTKIQLEIEFILKENTLVLHGEIVWKAIFSSSYEYGIDFTTPESERQQLIDDLKDYAKEKRLEQS